MPGLTITMSAPSAMSSATSRSASSVLRRVHLVDLLVALAEVGGRADGVAERAVEGARVLGAVGHDAGVDAAVALRAPRGSRRCGRPSCRSARRCRRRPRPAPAPGASAPRRSRRSGCSRSSSSRPSWPWLVYGSSATSVITPSSGKRCFSSRTARGTRPFGIERLAAVGASSAPGRSPGTAPSPGCRARRTPRRPAAAGRALRRSHAGHRGDVLRAVAGRRARTPADQVAARAARFSRTRSRVKSSRRRRRGRPWG